MSVMLATTNPDAVARAEPKAMPGLGETVIYHLRPGDRRSGRTSVPAWVLAVDEDNRELTLLVIYDHQDMMTFDRVPERIGTDQGWVFTGSGGEVAALRAENAALRADVAAMSEGLEAFKLELAQTLFGDHDKPDTSFVDQMREFITTRQLDDAVAKLTKAKAKAK